MGFASAIIASAKKDEETSLERWLQSKLQCRIKEVTASLDELKTRTALQVALFETWNDLRWYIQRKGNTEAKALGEAVKVWLKDACAFCAVSSARNFGAKLARKASSALQSGQSLTQPKLMLLQKNRKT